MLLNTILEEAFTQLNEGPFQPPHLMTTANVHSKSNFDSIQAHIHSWQVTKEFH